LDGNRGVCHRRPVGHDLGGRQPLLLDGREVSGQPTDRVEHALEPLGGVRLDDEVLPLQSEEAPDDVTPSMVTVPVHRP
jgi:hypothetical protein